MCVEQKKKFTLCPVANMTKPQSGKEQTNRLVLIASVPQIINLEYFSQTWTPQRKHLAPELPCAEIWAQGVSVTIVTHLLFSPTKRRLQTWSAWSFVISPLNTCALYLACLSLKASSLSFHKWTFTSLLWTHGLWSSTENFSQRFHAGPREPLVQPWAPGTLAPLGNLVQRAEARSDSSRRFWSWQSTANCAHTGVAWGLTIKWFRSGAGSAVSGIWFPGSLFRDLHIRLRRLLLLKGVWTLKERGVYC